MKKATLIIPENIQNMECETNGVHPIVMVNALNIMQTHFSKVVADMAKKAVGDNEKLQEQWIDRLTKKYLGDNPGDKGLNLNRFN